MQPQRLCLCSCHQSVTDRYPLVGFDANEDADVVAAATACSQCIALHTRIFEKPPKRPAPVPLPTTYSTDGEGAES